MLAKFSHLQNCQTAGNLLATGQLCHRRFCSVVYVFWCVCGIIAVLASFMAKTEKRCGKSTYCSVIQEHYANMRKTARCVGFCQLAKHQQHMIRTSSFGAVLTIWCAQRIVILPSTLPNQLSVLYGTSAILSHYACISNIQTHRQDLTISASISTILVGVEDEAHACVALSRSLCDRCFQSWRWISTPFFDFERFPHAACASFDFHLLPRLDQDVDWST